jgi:hypothetical protein
MPAILAGQVTAFFQYDAAEAIDLRKPRQLFSSGVNAAEAAASSTTPSPGTLVTDTRALLTAALQTLAKAATRRRPAGSTHCRLFSLLWR